MEVSQKIKNGSITYSSNPASEYISKGNEISVEETSVLPC
jgi:hypothetical protein